jgi:hypothetical protein
MECEVPIEKKDPWCRTYTVSPRVTLKKTPPPETGLPHPDCWISAERLSATALHFLHSPCPVRRPFVPPAGRNFRDREKATSKGERRARGNKKKSAYERGGVGWGCVSCHLVPKKGTYSSPPTFKGRFQQLTLPKSLPSFSFLDTHKLPKHLSVLVFLSLASCVFLGFSKSNHSLSSHATTLTPSTLPSTPPSGVQQRSRLRVPYLSNAQRPGVPNCRVRPTARHCAGLGRH